jgi:hypothetical protein
VIVAVITLRTVALAALSGNVPNFLQIGYSLAHGASTAPVFPVTDTAIKVTGVMYTLNVRGVGFVYLLSPSVAPNFLEWIGQESTTISNGSVITTGFSSAAGNHIVFLDFLHDVDIENAPAPNNARAFVVKNASASPFTAVGIVTLIW